MRVKYRISFYVPETHAEAVKNALFEAGAGRYDNYEQCSWETRGIGQFRAKDAATPFLGSVGKLERVEELRIEMVCSEECLLPALRALVNSHPYEEPAYDAVSIISLEELEEGVDA